MVINKIKTLPIFIQDVCVEMWRDFFLTQLNAMTSPTDSLFFAVVVVVVVKGSLV